MIKALTPQELLALRPIPEDVLKDAVASQYGRIQGFQLGQVRKARAVTQIDLSREIKVSQTQISKLEQGDLARSQIETLRRYVEGLGGSLRVIAEFPDAVFELA